MIQNTMTFHHNKEGGRERTSEKTGVRKRGVKLSQPLLLLQQRGKGKRERESETGSGPHGRPNPGTKYPHRYAYFRNAIDNILNSGITAHHNANPVCLTFQSVHRLIYSIIILASYHIGLQKCCPLLTQQRKACNEAILLLFDQKYISETTNRSFLGTWLTAPFGPSPPGNYLLKN